MTKELKYLNLYAGLGGNRKLLPEHVKVTAVEKNETIAAYYQDQYPDDVVIVADAHDFLLKYYREFPFVWSSISCPTHSQARFWNASGGGGCDVVYPDMKLYEEILFLKHYYGKRGKWVLENVNPYYTPLIKPTATIGRHLFWANFEIANIPVPQANCRKGRQEISEVHGIDISGYDFDTRKDQLLRNCVHPELGLHVFNESNRVGLFQFV